MRARPMVLGVRRWGWRPGRGARPGAGLLVGVLALAAAACGGGGAAPPAPPSTGQQAGLACVQPEDQAQQVRFRGENGADLAGVVLGDGRVGVVLAHQAGEDLCSWLPYARALAEQGYRVLAFDFQGHGASSPAGRGGSLDGDVAAAAAALRERGAAEVVLVGASMGGTAAVIAATKVQPPVAGVVSISAPGQYEGMNALRAARDLTVPVLFIAARQDGAFPDDAERLHALAAGAPDRRLVLVEGSVHGSYLLENTEPDAGQRARDAVESFLRDHAPAGG